MWLGEGLHDAPPPHLRACHRRNAPIDGAAVAPARSTQQEERRNSEPDNGWGTEEATLKALGSGRQGVRRESERKVAALGVGRSA